MKNITPEIAVHLEHLYSAYYSLWRIRNSPNHVSFLEESWFDSSMNDIRQKIHQESGIDHEFIVFAAEMNTCKTFKELRESFQQSLDDYQAEWEMAERENK